MDASQKHIGMPVDGIEGCYFSVLSEEEIIRLSVMHVTNSNTFDTLGHPTTGGLYDSRMGPLEFGALCGTCGQNSFQCAGHLGHIELPAPVYNPLLYMDLIKLVRGICVNCRRLAVEKGQQELFVLKMKLLDIGNLHKFNEVSLSAVQEVSDVDLSSYVQTVEREMFAEPDIMDVVPENSKNRNLTEARDICVKNFISEFLNGKIAKCTHCSQAMICYKNDKNTQITYRRRTRGAKSKAAVLEGDPNSMFPDIEGFISVMKVRDIVRTGWKQCEEVLCYLYGRPGRFKPFPDMFFISILPVIPPKFRPFAVMGTRRAENGQTMTYTAVMKIREGIVALQSARNATSEKMQEIINDATLRRVKGGNLQEKLFFAWNQLQENVNHIYDSARVDGKAGVRQIIEKKQGLYRMNIMGKRVNFAARSVITPDPMIDTNQVGVPFVFASKLTFPEPVNETNYHYLRQLVINGPNKHPGANYVIDNSGARILLSATNVGQRKNIANQLLKPSMEYDAPKVVLRHLIDGDVVCLNRQPTLHKPSIQAHIVKILRKERTIRLHYSACKAYNADFDGDEINMHFPQSNEARSEGYLIMNAANQYLVPKDGTPLGGLIQDHIVAAVHMTIRGSMFEKEHYQQLVFSALPYTDRAIELMPPAIVKPARLWSGKQIISTILRHIVPISRAPNLDLKSKLANKLFHKFPPNAEQSEASSKFSRMDENVVVIRDGLLLQGVIDKSNIGSANHSLTHCLYELYGPLTASAFLSALSKLMTIFLQRYRGFSVGVKDIVCTPEAEKARRDINKQVEQIGKDAVTSTFELPADASAEVIRSALRTAHCKKDLFLMSSWENTVKGKLGTMNQSITTACIPYGLKHKFPNNNLLMMIESGSKGSAINMSQIACQCGQIELEGRRVQMQISGKQLPCFLPYDIDPISAGFNDDRFETGLNPAQFVYHAMAGREGLVDTVVKTSRSGYLQRCLIKHLEGVTTCYDHTVRDADQSVVQFLFGEDGLDVMKTGFLTPKCFNLLFNNYRVLRDQIHDMRKFLDGKSALDYLEDLSVNAGAQKSKRKAGRRLKSTREPVNALYPSQRYFHSVSDKYASHVTQFCAALAKKKSNARDLLDMKYMKAISEPGEPLGLLTGQSIGEPSTQMTLNTFHFAGRGEVNVTLGIPRLREILQVASKEIKTPTMKVPLIDESLRPEAEKLTRDFYKVYLKEVLEKVEINQNLAASSIDSGIDRVYKIKFYFAHRKYFRPFTSMKPGRILRYMEGVFFKHLCRQFKLRCNLKSGEASFNAASEGVDDAGNVMSGSRSARRDSGGDSDAETNEEVAGSSAAKVSRLVDDEKDYDDERDPDDVVVDSDVEVIDDDEEEENGEGDDDDKSVVDVTESVERKAAAREAATAAVDSATYAKRVNNVIGGNVLDYQFDRVKFRWCEVTLAFPLFEDSSDLATLIQEEAAKCVVQNLHGVNRAVMGDSHFITDGVNVAKLAMFGQIFDCSKLYSNSIHHMRVHFGVEAAYRAIMNELGAVFDVYGIGVDKRYLSLLADFMTQNGEIMAFNRTSIASNPSHLQKMSFESAYRFLKESCLSGYAESGRSPSASITLGRVCRVGTGALDLVNVKA